MSLLQSEKLTCQRKCCPDWCLDNYTRHRCTAPKSRSKATIRVNSGTLASRAMSPSAGCGHWSARASVGQAVQLCLARHSMTSPARSRCGMLNYGPAFYRRPYFSPCPRGFKPPPVGICAGGKTDPRERADREASIFDFHPEGAAAALVKVAMRREKGILLTLRQSRHAIDVMVAIALDMGQTEQVHEGNILLQSQARLRRTIFARH